MNKISSIFGIKDSVKQNFANPERQSIEQTEDYAIKKSVQTKQGSVADTPINNKDIANKKYVDDQIQTHASDFWTRSGGNISPTTPADNILGSENISTTKGNISTKNGHLYAAYEKITLAPPETSINITSNFIELTGSGNNVDNITNADESMFLYIKCNDSNVTFINNPNLRLQGGGNITSNPDLILHLVLIFKTWWEVSRCQD